MHDHFSPIADGELWQGLDSWQSDGTGMSVATVIGRLFIPKPNKFNPRTYLPKSPGFRAETETVHELFEFGVQHYLENSGITYKDATVETGLSVGTRTAGAGQSWRIDCPKTNAPVLKFLLTRGEASPASFAIGEVHKEDFDAASTFLHSEKIGTEKLEKFVPEPGALVMFLGHLTLYEKPKSQGWGETHEATVWLNSRPAPVNHVRI